MSALDDLPTTYDPRSVESDMNRLWVDGNHFHADPTAGQDPTYTIVIPPPNVTGALHGGHALNNTLQDILIRWHRMHGCNTLWMPGTDHAGIATQAVVEKRVFENEKKSRHDLGRDELVRRIWEWKEQYGNRIIEQLKLMGCSCDWERTRFTLDDMCARAVRHTFFKLFKDGLIVRGKRLVNWDTHLQTAVADDEVYHEKVKGHLWHIRYPLKNPLVQKRDGRDVQVSFLVVATTRPETMLGDTAVAVHPEDPRWQPLIGKTVILPLLNKEIPVIADPILVDREFGSGCVKVTPAHDPNDYACGQRNGLAMVNILTPDGKINENGGPYAGLDRYAARKQVVADLEEQGLIERIEDHESDVGHSDRSKTPVEPYLSDQWFIRMGDLDREEASRIEGLHGSAGLAQLAMDMVCEQEHASAEERKACGKVHFFPGRYAKTYLDWLGEKRDWCISRQLWWGHRIPVWRVRFHSRLIDHATEHEMRSQQQEAMRQLKADLDEMGAAVGCQGQFLLAATDEESPWVCYVCTLSNAADKQLADIREDLTPAGMVGLFENDEIQITIPPLDPRFEVSRRIISHVQSLERDPDVLDTWFSSALWPHSTLGWPEDTAELRRYYPGSVLSTAREIITLWVARMVLTGMYNLGKVPFHDVYIHAVIQDGQGRPFKKTLGNGFDPVDIIEVYGADALRYTMASLTTETQDIRMPMKKVKLDDGRELQSSERFELGRNFCNKLWNAARFAFMNLVGENGTPQASTSRGLQPARSFERDQRLSPEEPPRGLKPRGSLVLDALPIEDRWILARVSRACVEVQDALASFQFSRALTCARDFFWDALCDWYLELVKSRVRENRQAAEARQVLAFALDQSLRLLHPFVPFITERLWRQLNDLVPHRSVPCLDKKLDTDHPLIVSDYPPAEGWPALDNPQVEAVFADLQTATRAVRDIRQTQNVPPRQAVDVTIRVPAGRVESLKREAHVIRHLANVGGLTIAEDAPKPAGAATLVIGDMQIFVAGVIDPAAERTRLQKELQNLEKQITGLASKLSNESFVGRAPADVVQRERDRLADLRARCNTVLRTIAELD
ncbi:MAG: valine--tRNA ligase [Phycisphaerae bacterium]|nr:valine--tRNA ligase [Phycisphaerae bacterium]